MSTADKLDHLRTLREESHEGGGATRLEQQHARGKLSARERLDLLLDEDSFTELDAFVTHRASEFGLDEERYLGDGVITGLRSHRRAAGVRLQPGLHRLRRVALGGARREDLQGDGPGDREWRADHRTLRLRGRAHPGRRRQSWRLRGHLPAQHPGFGCHPADLAGHGTVRRRRRLLAGDHGPGGHGRRHQLHVRHRAERGEDGDA